MSPLPEMPGQGEKEIVRLYEGATFGEASVLVGCKTNASIVSGQCVCTAQVFGCTEPGADNYNQAATVPTACIYCGELASDEHACTAAGCRLFRGWARLLQLLVLMLRLCCSVLSGWSMCCSKCWLQCLASFL